MLHTRARLRALATPLVASAASLAVVGATAAPSVAASDTYPARVGSSWLSAQPEDGLITSFGSYEDQGLTLDAFYALRATRTQTATQGAILDRLSQDDQVTKYTTYTDGATTTYYPGAAAKLLTALEVAGRDVSAVGGGTLVQDIEAAVNAAGRVDGADAEDYDNTINQAWIVRGLAQAGSSERTAAAGFLVRQQCAGGGFRESMADGGGCAQAAAGARTPSVEATAYAVRALLDARSAGVGGLTDDLVDARTWLKRAQRSDGSFVGNGVRNADATGLAGDALRHLGSVGASANAAGWLLAHQVRSSTIERSPALSGQRGAIAYGDASMATARKDGITGDSAVYEWRKATADGVLGLLGLLPSKRVRLVAPDRARRGAKVWVHVRGLHTGERFVLRRNGVVVSRGLVPSDGVADRKVALPRRGKVVLRVVGSRPGRLGATTIRVR